MEQEQQEQPRQPKVILAFDEEVIRELEDTTEIQTPAGYTTYHPAQKGQDHNTSGLRCVMAAIVRYYTMMLDLEEFPIEEFGWIDVGGRQWTPTW